MARPATDLDCITAAGAQRRPGGRIGVQAFALLIEIDNLDPEPDANPAAIRRLGTDQHPQQRGFTRPIAANQADPITTAHQGREPVGDHRLGPIISGIALANVQCL